MGVATGDDMLLDKPKVGVVLVDIVFLDARRQATDHKKTAIPKSDTACAVKHLRRLVLGHAGKVGGIVDVDPRIGVPLRVIELAEIDRHIQLPVVETEIAVMIA